MSDAMLNPASIPVFVGDLDQLDKDVSSLRSDAIGIRDGAVAIHSRFQMLEMHYKAPEAGDLLASTRPVSQKAEVFATDLETMADALATFSAEARPLVAKLNRLKAEAFAFVGKAEGDDEWSYDEDMVAEHDRLLSGVNAAEAAFREAERVTASKISAIVGGTRFIEDDGSHKRTEDVVMYGVSAEALDRAEQLPWGSPVSESHHWWELDHQIKSFVWDGLIVDNIWGGIQGLGTLVGVDGFDAAGDAWGGLGDIAGGIGQYAFTPVDKVLDRTFGEDEESPTETRQKQAATDFAKSLVAWDMWDENPARASATVVFTGLTLGLAPLAGTATAGRAGAATRAAAATARAGQYLDPLYAAAQVTGRTVGALPRISEVTANLRAGFGAGADLSPHSTLELADGSKVRIEDGEFIRVDADGTRIEDTARHELAADDRGNPRDGASLRERTSVSAAPGAPADASHAPVGEGRTGDSAAGSTQDHALRPARNDPSSGGYHAAGEESTSGNGDLSGGHGNGDEGAKSGNASREPTPERANEPLPELTPEAKTDHEAHLDALQVRNPDDFDLFKLDPDHKGRVTRQTEDEAKIGLDLREQRRIPDDIRRPPDADSGDFYSPSTGKYYDIKGIHSDWPPINFQRNKTQPFRGAYDPANNAKFISNIAQQIGNKGRTVIMDTRNANQAAIDDVRMHVAMNGWEDNVVWYP